jgi:transposase
MIELLFPPEAQLVIEDVQVQIGKIDIYARRCVVRLPCPDCQQMSEKEHSHYKRHPHDLPCFGFRVQLHLRVRRFFCHHMGCSRRTFAETFPELVCYKARRTIRLSQQQLAVAFAVSGETGRRLLSSLAMPLSGDTLIRDIRRMPDGGVVAPRVLGIDDWAKKRGHTYGTILVNLETKQPIDLLDSREAKYVTAWLKQHTGIEIISRDRAYDYAKAVNEGAPEAQQVADRWHLLKNLREAVETMLSHKPTALAAAGKPNEGKDSDQQAADTKEEIATAVSIKSTDKKVTSAPNNPPLTKAQKDKAARHARRQARFELVKQLHKEGYSIRTIQRHLKISWHTVRKYIEADVCPQYSTGRVRPSILTPWLPYLEERWQAGYTNATQLWREIEAQGFAGSRGLVSRWAAKERKLLPQSTQYSRQQPREVRPKLTKQTRPVPWSSPRASWILVKDRSQLDEQEKAALERMVAADKQVELVAQLAERFVKMIKQKEPDKLAQWLKDAVASGVRSLISFANGVRQDYSAVCNALSSIWSNGQVEGQVNRLKFIKRMMYGRANFDLLRKCVLYQPVAI